MPESQLRQPSYGLTAEPSSVILNMRLSQNENNHEAERLADVTSAEAIALIEAATEPGDLFAPDGAAVTGG